MLPFPAGPGSGLLSRGRMPATTGNSHRCRATEWERGAQIPSWVGFPVFMVNYLQIYGSSCGFATSSGFRASKHLIADFVSYRRRIRSVSQRVVAVEPRPHGDEGAKIHYRGLYRLT